MDLPFLNELTTSANYEALLTFMGNLLSGIIILVLGVVVSRRIAAAIRKNLGRMSRFDPTLVPLVASLARYAVLIIALVAMLGSIGIQTTSIIAVLGAAGLAIGLALQGTLSNVAAGVMLLFLRPFQAGDWIETGANSGTVTEIGLFTTIITTFDNVFISVPNSAIWGAWVINHSRNNTRRMDIDIGIAYSTDLDHAEQSLLKLAKDPRVLTDPEPRFLVVNFGDSAITVRLRLYANNDVYWDLYWDMMRQVKPVLDAANIEIPFPQRDVRMVSSD
ncbi:MAG: mechanosensitive ion channel [Alphaproteobacteria bacterium]|nr:mechanosensitive ion channel [Alphaproteobacteria bacterium]